MGYGLNGRFMPESYAIATNVTLHPSGQISATTKAALKALSSELRFDGLEAVVTADRSKWTFSAASTAADTTDHLVMTPDVGTGRWLRADKAVDLKLAIAFGTADAAVLYTVPAGFNLHVVRTFWEVTTNWTGGSSSAIGLSSAQTGLSTKGDLLGGAAGDVAAGLTTTLGYAGTLGAGFASQAFVHLKAASTVRFDRITSVFTAGAGFAHLYCHQIV